MSNCGLVLLEFLREYEGKTIGKCTFIDGLTNPINLSLEARDRGLELVIVGCELKGEGDGYEVYVFEPFRNSDEAVKMIGDAWAGFLGSNDVNNLALALRFVHDDMFRVIKLRCSDLGCCKDIILNVLGNLCISLEA